MYQVKLFKGYRSPVHGFGDRRLGDDYDRVARIAGVAPHDVVRLKQIHSNRVFVINTPLTGLEGDALVTDKPGMVLTIKTADCVPLLVFDPSGRKIAAIHAGWKGVLGGVIEESFRYLSAASRVGIGPTLCKKCFAVDADVLGEFQKKFGRALAATKRADKYLIDLSRAVLTILKKCGIGQEQTETIPLCTACHHDRLYSFRRGDERARQVSFICLLGNIDRADIPL